MVFSALCLAERVNVSVLGRLRDIISRLKANKEKKFKWTVQVRAQKQLYVKNQMGARPAYRNPKIQVRMSARAFTLRSPN